MVMISCSNGKERGEAGHLETIFEAEGTAKNGNPSGWSRQGFQITEIKHTPIISQVEGRKQDGNDEN